MPGVLSKSKGLLALEMIDFQNDDFGVNIEVIVTKIRNDIESKEIRNYKQLAESKHIKDLTSLIYKRLGIKVKFIVDTFYLAAVMPFYINKNHIFLHEYFRGNFTLKDQQAIINEANGKKGYVDIAKAKVSGIYSEYETPMFITFHDLIRMGMTDAEITAIILHELGHAFYACEYADRLESNNQVLAKLSRTLNGDKEDKQLTYVYKELKSLNEKITEEDVDAIVNGNRVVSGVKWFKVLVGAVQVQLKNSKYDETSFEQLADNFASRFKYGRSLITGLDKLTRSYGGFEVNSATRYQFMFFETMFFIFSAVSMFSIALGPAFLFPAIIGGFVMWIGLSSGSEDNVDYTYDSLRDRYKRVRNDMVEMLKNPNLDKTMVKEMLDNIYMSDKMINETAKYKSIFNTIANFIFSSGKNAKNSILEQRLIEDLAFNDLFIKSAEFKTLA